jgi:uncharacterized protein (TIGR00369 family)
MSAPPAARPADAAPDPSDAAPEGFVYLEGRGPFSARNGPFYARKARHGVEHGFRVRPHHCNSYGLVHGGLLAGFLDGVLAHAVFAETGASAVTLRLTVDYLDMTRQGAWVSARAKATAGDGDLVFVEAVLDAEDRPIATAKAVFKLMRGRSPPQSMGSPVASASPAR